MKKGKFYGIGVGVGDPENITLKAVKRLEEVDVLVFPQATSIEDSSAYKIVKEHIREDAEKIFMEFPMLKDVEARKVFRKNNADRIKAELNKGKNVGFLTIGDPMTYSTYTHVLDLMDEDVHVETIAGITSFQSIATRTNVPLTIGDESLKIVSVHSGTDIRKEIEENDNLVFMKISRNFEKLKQVVMETGNAENVLIVSECGKAEEVIYTSMEGLETVPYFTTMILKKKGLEQWKKFIL